MERSPFLPLPEGMVIGQVEIAESQLTVEVISTQPFARCPGCAHAMRNELLTRSEQS